MRKAYCDMCGKELHSDNGRDWVTVYVDRPQCRKSLDFCASCSDKFWSLLDHLGEEAGAVRCRDCKHFQVNVSPSGYLPQGVPEWECRHWCRHWCRPTDPTDFCSYGEKMEEE